MITVRNLSHTFPNATHPALRSLEFQVAPGEIFGIAGPSGAGKSTLLGIFAGLIRDYSGAVEYKGKELKDWSRDFYESVGICLQAPDHFPKLTALENLNAFAALYAGDREPAGTLLDQVGLGPEAHVRVGRFSPEMKKRLGLARALLPRPEALFLDDPFSGLDPAGAARVAELLRTRKRAGRTTVVTLSDAAPAEPVCDRIAFLAEGNLTGIRPAAPRSGT